MVKKKNKCVQSHSNSQVLKETLILPTGIECLKSHVKSAADDDMTFTVQLCHQHQYLTGELAGVGPVGKWTRLLGFKWVSIYDYWHGVGWFHRLYGPSLAQEPHRRPSTRW